MAIFYMGKQIQGEPQRTEIKTTWRSIGDKVIFAVGQFEASESTRLTVSFC